MTERNGQVGVSLSSPRQTHPAPARQSCEPLAVPSEGLADALQQPRYRFRSILHLHPRRSSRPGASTIVCRPAATSNSSFRASVDTSSRQLSTDCANSVPTGRPPGVRLVHSPSQWACPTGNTGTKSFSPSDQRLIVAATRPTLWQRPLTPQSARPRPNQSLARDRRNAGVFPQRDLGSPDKLIDPVVVSGVANHARRALSSLRQFHGLERYRPARGSLGQSVSLPFPTTLAVKLGHEPFLAGDPPSRMPVTSSVNRHQYSPGDLLLPNRPSLRLQKSDGMLTLLVLRFTGQDLLSCDLSISDDGDRRCPGLFGGPVCDSVRHDGLF